MLGLVLPAFAQYAGPAILSRGEAPAAMSAPQVDFAVSVSLSANYTTGLSQIGAPNSQGQLATASGEGAGIGLGISGTHSWKHTKLGVNYTGGYSYYPDSNTYNGITQGLSVGLTHQLSRHISLSLRENAGWFTSFAPSTTTLSSTVQYDPSQSYIPNTDFYNNRTIYTTTQASMTVQKSTRLSFNFSGGYFANLRSASALYNAYGMTASGDAQYRLSRRTTVGAGYNFVHFSYGQSQGAADVHSMTVDLSERLSRWTEFSFFGGASRVESNFLQTVPVDPGILAILCPPTSTVACPLTSTSVISHSVFWGPDFGARFSRAFQRGAAYLSVGESITPGNGLFLTSRAFNAGGGYGYSGLKQWSLNASVQYSTALSFGNVTGGYGSVSGGISMGHKLFGAISLTSSFSATQYQSNSFTLYNHLVYSASVGLGYSTKGIPVRLF
jgi:hypothetical protein